MAGQVFNLVNVPNVQDIESPSWRTGALSRLVVSPPALVKPAQELLYIDDPAAKPQCLPDGSLIIAGQEPSTAPFLSPALHCYFAEGVVVSGNGLMWLNDELLVIDEITPSYWCDPRSGHSPQSTPETDIHLPVRTISGPCVSGPGWGGRNYVYVILDVLPRVIAAFEVMKGMTRPKLLLQSDTPDWAMSMLKAVGVTQNDIEWFNPKSERIKLEQGIFPANLGITHPYLEKLFSSIDPHFTPPARYGIYYLSTATFPHRRGCTNEGVLESIAMNEFGAEVICLEELPWLEKVRLFKSAKAVVGLAGSALHTALVSDGGLTVGHIGATHHLQSAIAALRGQRLAYQVGFSESDFYKVPEEQFRELMSAIYRCNDNTLASVA
ncbi:MULTISPECIES: glycosyltransferase family 61 protein [Agrobacterium]|uniref:glycosyltransferase family 61 protein n=1 Tax=Agrobacterium TaxID=357 RepID=UPI000FDF28FD|nr:glycosyltransferase family 61 protein [Agrobacterium sp. RS6]UXU07947.1 glycosyltransferase family 61 protein [Agrobacterium tumefaciens]